MTASEHDGQGLLKSEETRLFRTIRNGPEAQRREAEERVIVTHLPLVRAIVWQLYRKNRKYVDPEDLLAAGYEGLVMALRRFDPNRGCRFNTYAMWWVRNRIGLEIRRERWLINIPDHLYKLLLRVMRFVGEFRDGTGRDPTLPEIAQKVGRTAGAIRNLLAWMEQQAVSLSTPVGDDGSSTLGDLIEDRSTLIPSDVVDNVDLKDQIAQILRTLTPREEKIIKMRFGLENGESNNLVQVGHSYALSVPTVLRIEAKALRKLRHPARTRKLEPFIRLARQG